MRPKFAEQDKEYVRRLVGAERRGNEAYIEKVMHLIQGVRLRPGEGIIEHIERTLAFYERELRQVHNDELLLLWANDLDGRLHSRVKEEAKRRKLELPKRPRKTKARVTAVRQDI